MEVGQIQHPVRRQRLLGLTDAAAALHVSLEEVIVTERDYNSREEGALGAAALLDAAPDVTAIVCLTDILAVGALDALSARGIAVPDDMTVTGFDDVPTAGAFGLTTVHQPLEAKGRAAVEMLLDDRPRSRAKRLVLPTELVVRTSSSPPRRHRLPS
jgi:DNA-binding LacI/PurR family transcriptional regulator